MRLQLAVSPAKGFVTQRAVDLPFRRLADYSLFTSLRGCSHSVGGIGRSSGLEGVGILVLTWIPMAHLGFRFDS